MVDVDFLVEATGLNEILRTGWVQRGVEEPQDVAGHTWGVTLLTMLHADEAANVDASRAVRMAIVHDLPEAQTGDVAEGDGRSVEREDQLDRERLALDSLLGESDCYDEVRDLWEEFETRATPESRFVRDMDRIEMCVHALKYTEESRYDEATVPDGTTALDEFFESARESIRTEVGERLFEELLEEYETVRETE